MKKRKKIASLKFLVRKINFSLLDQSQVLGVANTFIKTVKEIELKSRTSITFKIDIIRQPHGHFKDHDK